MVVSAVLMALYIALVAIVITGPAFAVRFYNRVVLWLDGVTRGA